VSFCPVYPITRLVRSVWISDCCTSKVDLEPIRFLRYVIETLSEVDFIGFDYIHVELFCQRLRPVEVAPWTRSTRRVVQLVQVAYLHKPASCMICLIIDQLPIALPCQFRKILLLSGRHGYVHQFGARHRPNVPITLEISK
jgi:hypothetical protein